MLTWERDAEPGEFASEPYAQYNKAQNEKKYVTLFGAALQAAGMPTTPSSIRAATASRVSERSGATGATLTEPAARALAPALTLLTRLSGSSQAAGRREPVTRAPLATTPSAAKLMRTSPRLRRVPGTSLTLRCFSRMPGPPSEWLYQVPVNKAFVAERGSGGERGIAC